MLRILTSFLLQSILIIHGFYICEIADSHFKPFLSHQEVIHLWKFFASSSDSKIYRFSSVLEAPSSLKFGFLIPLRSSFSASPWICQWRITALLPHPLILFHVPGVITDTIKPTLVPLTLPLLSSTGHITELNSAWWPWQLQHVCDRPHVVDVWSVSDNCLKNSIFSLMDDIYPLIV